MEGNDKALLVGVLGALLVVWQWTGTQALKRDNDRLQAQLLQVQLQLQSFREGVLSK
ncbi:hypothetical protein [Leptolyngbya sp. 'hensonii']|uniref:hypothetical protein n=1 Tax=Leptolyngbya sp. 'hensonii' TaxID=1922337 RepID=UPI000AA40806|nr:hypothetical protein [Leptolyngbya sp. 'hensonii']